MLWVYLRRHEHFIRFRNTVLLANVIGLVGYVLEPTAPPRMFSTVGFKDTLDSISGINHGSAFVQLAANPYAAMPSLHAADALIVGVVPRRRLRHWWSKAHLGALAGLGLVLRDGDREPLPARRARRDRRRARSRSHSSRSCRASAAGGARTRTGPIANPL